MLDFDRTLSLLAARRKSLVTRADALAAGIPAPALDLRVRAGVLVVLYDGIYRHAAAPFTHDMRLLAAVLACGPDAVLSHRPAARLLGFPGARGWRPAVTTPHTDLPRADGIDLHRTRRLLPAEVTTVDGIPVTALGRTAVDYCAVTPLHVATEVIAQAVIAKVLAPATILAAIERSGGRGRPGTANLRSIASQLDELDGIESVLERDLAAIADSAAVPRAVRQHEMTCADGRRVRLDLAWPEVGLAVEGDGRRWHATPARKRATRERRESILATGWRHLAYGWADAQDTPGDVRIEIEESYRACAAHAAA